MLVIPGEIITTDKSYIPGHGTYNKTSLLYGNVIYTNKLITVHPKYNLRYTPNIGDIVIGRVSNIYNKKWKIDINCKQNVVLNLSAINLPNLEQRKKLEEDEVKMREFFDVNDVIVGEVQRIGNVVNLHTRNVKCGKRSNVLVELNSTIVKKYVSNFLVSDHVEVVIGVNGNCCVGGEVGRVKMVVKYLKECGKSMKMVDDKIIYELIK